MLAFTDPPLIGVKNQRKKIIVSCIAADNSPNVGQVQFAELACEAAKQVSASSGLCDLLTAELGTGGVTLIKSA